jgi:hypothetical protein
LHGLIKLIPVPLTGAQRRGLLDVLAGDPAAAHDYEYLVLFGQFFEGLSVLLEAFCIAACKDGAAERIDESHKEWAAPGLNKKVPRFWKALEEPVKRGERDLERLVQIREDASSHMSCGSS